MTTVKVTNTPSGKHVEFDCPHLSPFEKWMVQSNLNTISKGEMSADTIDATLRTNGYPSIADAVKTVLAAL